MIWLVIGPWRAKQTRKWFVIRHSCWSCRITCCLCRWLIIGCYCTVIIGL